VSPRPQRRGERALAAAAGLAALAIAAAPARSEPPPIAGWPSAGGDAGNSRYSPLSDIRRENVASLEVAWTYRHGDYHDGGWPPGARSGTAFEATPILVEGRLLVSTPYNRVIALDPETGRELWVFDPQVDRERRYSNGYVNRGVAFWRDSRAEGFCAGRVLVATVDSRLIALDVASGRPCPRFGKGGTVDLHVGVMPLREPEYHKMTSPPMVIGDVIVTGASLADSRPDQPPGDVRGWDARSGRLLWTFHVVPHPGEPGSETWERGSLSSGVGANPWAPLAADLERGLVFVPTSSASPDLYGGRRPGDNLFADSLLVLRAQTGERVWHFQTVHHDLWDYDLGSPPNLVRLRRDGREIDAVAQLTKTGFVFVFDRETGEPVFPIEERPVPQSDVAGEQTSPTQPFPLRPPPLVPQRMSEADLWDRDPQELARCRAALRGARNEGIFTPPSERGSVLYPSPAGGANWSGGAFDPESGLLYVPSLNFALLARVEPPAGEAPGPVSGPRERLLRRLAPGRAGAALPPLRRATMDHSFFTCLAPPWGLLVAVDLNQGEIRWRVPIGEDANGVRGLFHMGHALVTAGGLVFHAGSEELRLRAHDAATGEVLASFPLPAGLHAGPMTYKLRPGGRQYLVIAPGGHYGVGRVNRATVLGDWVIAYALPDGGALR